MGSLTTALFSSYKTEFLNRSLNIGIDLLIQLIPCGLPQGNHISSPLRGRGEGEGDKVFIPQIPRSLLQGGSLAKKMTSIAGYEETMLVGLATARIGIFTSLICGLRTKG
jgi:hypothetical protein